MVIKTNWYVFTGGPCSGKSKTLEYLASLGYFTFPEIARVFIDLEIAKGRKIEEIRKDEVKFQNKILQMKIELENKLSPEQTVFLDRGIPDSVAYFKEVGLDTKRVIEESRKRIYKKVFFMKLFRFEKDYARTEDEETAERISKLIFETYTKLGYQLIEVPVMKTIEEKAKFILSRL